ncbi:RNase H domain-containing protein [Trichonephila clavipes]|nr:RNase H domain-containing protein [Trichonephila clavipes]
MSLSGGQSEARSPVFKSLNKPCTRLSTHSRREARPSRERSCGRPCEGGYQQSCGFGRPHGPYIDWIYSRAEELICRTWVVPPVHPWHFQRHPGSAISFKGSRSYQTAFSRNLTG